MTVYNISLSTSEPNNHVGLIKIRQDDQNSQTLVAKITDSNKPRDFTGLTVFMNIRTPGSNYVVRDKVTDVDYLNNTVTYTLIDSFWQEIGVMNAWFSFEGEIDGVPYRDSVANFNYTVIEGNCRNIRQGNYIWEFEQILQRWESIESLLGTDAATKLAMRMTAVEQAFDDLEVDVQNRFLAMVNQFNQSIKELEESKVDKVIYNQDINDLRTKKADQSFVDAQLQAIVSGAPKETFTTLNALKAKYPNGTAGIFLVLENGHWYYWPNAEKGWTDGGVYQGLELTIEAKQSVESYLDERFNYLANGKISTGKLDPFKPFAVGLATGTKIQPSTIFKKNWVLCSNTSGRLTGTEQLVNEVSDIKGHEMSFNVKCFSYTRDVTIKATVQYFKGATIVQQDTMTLDTAAYAGIKQLSKTFVLYPSTNVDFDTFNIITFGEVASGTISIALSDFSLSKTIVDFSKVDNESNVYDRGNYVKNGRFVLPGTAKFSAFTSGLASGTVITRKKIVDKNWLNIKNVNGTVSGAQQVLDIKSALGREMTFVIEAYSISPTVKLSMINQYLNSANGLIEQTTKNIGVIDNPLIQEYEVTITIPSNVAISQMNLIVVGDGASGIEFNITNIRLKASTFVLPDDYIEYIQNGNFSNRLSEPFEPNVQPTHLNWKVVTYNSNENWLIVSGDPDGQLFEGPKYEFYPKHYGLTDVRIDFTSGVGNFSIGLQAIANHGQGEILWSEEKQFYIGETGLGIFSFRETYTLPPTEPSTIIKLFFVNTDGIGPINLAMRNVSVKQGVKIQKNELRKRGLLNLNPDLTMKGLYNYRANGVGTTIEKIVHNGVNAIKVKADNNSTSIRALATTWNVPSLASTKPVYLRFNLQGVKQTDFGISIQWVKTDGSVIRIDEPTGYPKMSIEQLQKYHFKVYKPDVSDIRYMIVYIFGEKGVPIEFIVSEFEIDYNTTPLDARYSVGGGNISDYAQASRLPFINFTGDTSQMTKDNPVTLGFEYFDHERKIECFAEVKWQGSSSIGYPKKNYTIKLFEDATLGISKKIKLNETMDSFNKYVLKANYIDVTHARNNVAAKIWGQMSLSRQGDPELLRQSMNYGAIDGFPILVFINDSLKGIYSFNSGKDDPTWMMDKTNPKHTALIGESWVDAVLFKANEALLDGSDWKLEVGKPLPETISDFNRLLTFVNSSSDVDFKANIHDYLHLNTVIDYYLLMQIINASDNFGKNSLCFSYDGLKWGFTPYDLDSTFSINPYGNALIADDSDWFGAQDNRLFVRVSTLFSNEVKMRYKELRGETFTPDNLVGLFIKWQKEIGTDNYEKDALLYPSIPSKNISNFKQLRQSVLARIKLCDNHFGY